MANNLILHCGANQVDRAEIDHVLTPQPSGRHYPVPHNQLIDATRNHFTGADYSVLSEAHSLTADGARYFGLLQVRAAIPWQGITPAVTRNPDDDSGLVVGIRNSHDCSFAASLVLGLGVFVCDNLSFSGEVKLARKHTRFIQRDLPALISRAVGQLSDQRKKQQFRIDAMKNTDCTDSEAHNLIIDALDCRAITATEIPKVLEQWRTPRHPEFRDRNHWSLYNGFTDVWRQRDIQATSVVTRSQRLHGLFDAHLNIAG